MTRIEQIRQREQVTGWGTFGELHADVTALLTLWGHPRRRPPHAGGAVA